MENRLEKYRTTLINMELSKGTVDIYMRYARKMEEYMAKEDFSKTTIVDYKQKLRQCGMAPATRNLAIIAVNKYLKYSGRGDCTVKTEKLQKRKSLENVISKGEYRKMLDTAKNSGRIKYYYLMKTLARTGIRIGELAFFTVDALDAQKITVCNKGKTREIYLPDKLITELKLYCTTTAITDGVIFRGNSKAPITRTAVYKMLLRIGAEAGIKKEKI